MRRRRANLDLSRRCRPQCRVAYMTCRRTGRRPDRLLGDVVLGTRESILVAYRTLSELQYLIHLEIEMSLSMHVTSLGALILVAGCATIIRGTEQQITVNTNPVGADLQFSNGQSCQSPCSLKVARNQSLQINVSKPECQTQTATMIPVLAGAGVILGGLIDYGTGAVYDLQPNPLTLTMACRDAMKHGGGQ